MEKIKLEFMLLGEGQGAEVIDHSCINNMW